MNKIINFHIKKMKNISIFGILTFSILILSSIGNSALHHYKTKALTKEFIDYHIDLIDSIVAIADRDLDEYGEDWETDFPCEYIRNKQWITQISEHLRQYNYIGIFSLTFNPPMMCGKSLAFNEDKFMTPQGIGIKMYDHHISRDLKLNIIIYEFEGDQTNFELFQGEVVISAVQQKHSNDSGSIMFTGKYNVEAHILIPKDFTEWKEKIQSKSIKEILDGSVKI
ncbi:MAG: hypothetical protein AB8B69_22605 [Chitinophagales bacterium]